MSALGHFLEEEGIATTIISLIRVHSEQVRPPRSLFVPFELGRPLGAPNDPAMQKQVLKAALDLLDRDDGPSFIEDFDYDGAYQEPTEDWQNPAADMAVDTDVSDMAAARAAVRTEVAALRPLYDKAVAQSGRDPVGTSGLAMEQIADYVTAFLGEPPESPPDGARADISVAMILRYAADDLTAFYLHATSAGSLTRDLTPSSVQQTDWFWQQTAAAKVLIALRAKWMDSDNTGLKTVCGRFMIPHMQIHGLGL
ncbi:MAG: hypothetical protein HOG12_06670 [Alphaproteobacteria bacterium]|nr:hypothetical protein [Alphaproteobacteria bacterium]